MRPTERERAVFIRNYENPKIDFIDLNHSISDCSQDFTEMLILQ